MATLKVEYPKDLLKLVGTELGPSEWVTVDQAMIDKFADATGDHQWIHVDVERAKREMPGGKTIAHGYLTLSLVPRMASTLLEVAHRSRGINYGSNKVRFISPVPHPRAPADRRRRRSDRQRRARDFRDVGRDRGPAEARADRRDHRRAVRVGSAKEAR